MSVKVTEACGISVMFLPPAHPWSRRNTQESGLKRTGSVPGKWLEYWMPSLSLPEIQLTLIEPCCGSKLDVTTSCPCLHSMVVNTER